MHVQEFGDPHPILRMKCAITEEVYVCPCGKGTNILYPYVVGRRGAFCSTACRDEYAHNMVLYDRKYVRNIRR